MVLTQSQYKNMSQEELTQELININSSFVNDLNAELTCLKRLQKFTSKYNKVYSELQQSKSFNSHLLTRIIQLERNTVTKSQQSRREKIELNPVPAEIHEDVLEESICKPLSLTEVNVVPAELQLCHCMKKWDRVIAKFKYRKQKKLLTYKCKNRSTTSQEFTNLKFPGRLFVSKSMSHENQQFAYKCWQLKGASKIYSTWFFNNVVNIQLTEHGKIHTTFHIADIKNLLEIDNLEEYINNASC